MNLMTKLFNMHTELSKEPSFILTTSTDFDKWPTMEVDIFGAVVDLSVDDSAK